MLYSWELLSKATSVSCCLKYFQIVYMFDDHSYLWVLAYSLVSLFELQEFINPVCVCFCVYVYLFKFLW